MAVSILWHLREIERRQLHLTLGFPSLFEYCVRSLGYSEGAAGRRIASMRLLREVPAVEASLASGKVTLSSLSSVHHFLRREESKGRASYSPRQKLELVKKIEGKSRRQTEEILASISPESAVPLDRERVLNDEQVEVRFVADRRLLERLDRLKGLVGDRTGRGMSYADLFEQLADIALKKLVPSERSDSTPPAKSKANSSPALPLAMPTKRAGIPAAMKREVWRRDGGCCSYKDPKSGRRCESRFALQIDHIEPVGKGGITALNNLRLLCRGHNILAAVNAYGTGHMSRFVPALN